MFKVSTVNLDADARHANVRYGEHDLGDLTPDQLTTLLESFRAIDPVEDVEAESQVIVTGRVFKLRVRTSGRKLLVYNARDISEPCTVCTSSEILQRLDEAPSLEAVASDGGPIDLVPTQASHHTLAIVLLALVVVINCYTIYSLLSGSDDINAKSDIALINDPNELATRRVAVEGNYATGDNPGDRIIIVGIDGRVQFKVIDNPNEGSDTCIIGRHDDKLCLKTALSGIIDIVDNDTLLYFKDTYHRAK